MALGPIRLEQDQTTAQLQVQKVNVTLACPLCPELVKSPQLAVTGESF